MNFEFSENKKNEKWELKNDLAPCFLLNVFDGVCKNEIQIINLTSVSDSNHEHEWKLESNNQVESNSIGMNDNHAIYHKINRNQSLVQETKKSITFIKRILNELGLKECNVEFINYGDTELVYVIKNGNNIKSTLLLSQPWLEKDVLKKEYNNLLTLKNICPKLVISPTQYFEWNNREAYLTPYYYQARCIATDYNYGVYIPEPYYRFESFSSEDSYLISKIIVASLIKLFDEKNNLGLASCKIGGGDFILEKGFDNLPHTETNAINNIHLTAARNLINIDLKEYIKLLRKELVQRTYYNSEEYRDKSILINLKNRAPMSIEAIEDGIDLGLKLRK